MVTFDTALNGRYHLLEVLGEGGMGRVFRAEDQRLQRIVAVKILHRRYLAQPEFLRRFAQEAQLAARLTHPHIVAIYDVGQDSTTPYIVMEYVAGQSLRDLIAGTAPLSLSRIVPLMLQLGDALDAAHAQGVIHRDIKPENILLTSTGQVKVSDFGIARGVGEPRQTATGMMLGSVSYMSPEQAQGRLTSGASDLYSSGVILYELLTGRPPFAADSALATALLHVTEPPPPPSRRMPGLSTALDAVVLRALSKDPAQRFPSGTTLATALATVAGAQTSPEPTLIVRPIGKKARLSGRLLAVPLILLLSSVGIYVAMHESAHSARLSPLSQRSTSTPRPVLQQPRTGVRPPTDAIVIRHLHPTAIATIHLHGLAPTVPQLQPTATPIPLPSVPATARPQVIARAASPMHGQALSPTVLLQVIVQHGVALARLHFRDVAPAAEIAVRWTFPNQGTATVALGGAYSTAPNYSAYVAVPTQGTYRLAALVNGAMIGTRSFSVTVDIALRHSSGDTRPEGPPPRPSPHPPATPHHHGQRHPKAKGTHHGKP